MYRTHLLAAALAASSLFAAPVQAAESYANCTGFIDSLPATISAGGTWCLRKDLNTDIASGNAITITANNATIDCNDFKIGGLGAGPATDARGIFGSGALNVTVRHCNVRGFYKGIHLYSTGGGHLVEDNRLDGNTFMGMDVEGGGSIVRRNQVINTGGTTIEQAPIAIFVSSGDVDVIDNTVSGVGPGLSSSSSYSTGIVAFESSGSITGNRVRGLVFHGGGTAMAVQTWAGWPIIRDNDLTGPGAWGIQCDSGGALAGGNVINGFSDSVKDCRDTGNVVP